jgi:hypothetical protein
VIDRLTDNHPLDTLMLLGQAQERCGDLQASLAAFRRTADLYRELVGKQQQQITDQIRYRFGERLRESRARATPLGSRSTHFTCKVQSTSRAPAN